MWWTRFSRNAVSASRVEAKPLHGHLAGHRGHRLVVATHDLETVPESRGNEGVFPRGNGTVRHAFGGGLKPENVDGLAASVDDLQLGARRCGRVSGV
jgi:hypothetical protein